MLFGENKGFTGLKYISSAIIKVVCVTFIWLYSVDLSIWRAPLEARKCWEFSWARPKVNQN